MGIWGSARRVWVPQRGRREVLLALLLAAFCLGIGAYDGSFLSAGNARDILVNASYVAVVACGMTVVIAAGGIDVSVGSLLAVCATVAGLLARLGLPMPVVGLATLAAGAVLGALNGALVHPGRVPPIIATLAARSMWRGAIVLWMRGRWITDLPDSFRAPGLGKLLGIPVPVIVMVLAVALAAFYVRSTRPGRNVLAVGGNEQGAALAGIRVGRVRFFSYVLAGLSVGLATLVYATRFYAIQPNAGAGLELLAITAVVLGGSPITGGRASIAGTFLAVLLLTTLGTGLTFLHASAYWITALQGSIVLCAVVSDALAGRSRAAGAEGAVGATA